MPWTRSSAEVIAHRGASAAAPEHTVEAFDLAVAQGADVLELDVRPARDGELVVIHDATLARTAGDPRRVDQLTRLELERLAPSVRPLTLGQMLGRYGDSVQLLIELKDPEPETEGLLVDSLERHGMIDAVRVQVFDALALRRLRLRAPRLSLTSLHRRRPSARTLDTTARLAGGVGVLHRRIDAALVSAAHARGLAISAWTVNSDAAIDRVLRLGVDGVITDAPDVAALRAAYWSERDEVAAVPLAQAV